MTDTKILKAFIEEHGPMFKSHVNQRIWLNKISGLMYGNVFLFDDAICGLACQWLEGEILREHQLDMFIDGGVTDIRLYHKDNPQGEPVFQSSFGSKLQALTEAWKAVCCG